MNSSLSTDVRRSVAVPTASSANSTRPHRTLLNRLATLTFLACTFTVLLAAPAWADQCSAPTVGAGAGSVGSDTGGLCSVVITVAAVDGNGNATSFSVAATGVPAYDGSEDILVGVQNNATGSLNSLPLTSTQPIFGFDNDGPCTYNLSDCFGASGYEGPVNSFTVTNTTTGTVNFSTSIPSGGTTWFALEGTPQSLQSSSVTHTLVPGVQQRYDLPGFTDPYKITPSTTSTGGEVLTITAVPVLSTSFVPPANFPNETCVPFADASAMNGQDTCVEYQADCSYNGTPNGGDCPTLLYQLLIVYDLPTDLPAIGGPDGLVVHGFGCPFPSTALAQSTFTDYTVNKIDPTTTTKGSGTGSCFLTMYTPTAPPITSGTTSRFIGWQSPVLNGDLNLVKAGATRPLAFQLFDNVGNPIQSLNLCKSYAVVGGINVCQDSPAVSTPWVNLTSFGIVCPSSAPVNKATDGTTKASGKSGLQNLGGGNFQFNWQTMKSWKGSCFNVQATFDSGVAVIPATIGFQFN